MRDPMQARSIIGEQRANAQSVERSMSNIATKSNVKWDKKNRSVTDVTDDDIMDAFGKGANRKHAQCPVHDAQVLPGSPGSGAAPGASGPPTTGASVGPGGPLGTM